MTGTDRPAVGTRLFYLDGEGVLFSEPAQELHLLNPAATMIWSLLEEGHDAASASAALREITDLDPGRSAEFVALALGEWRKRGWLEGSSPVVPQEVPAPAPAASAAHNLPPLPRYAPVGEQHYRILDTTFSLRFSGLAQADMVRPTVEHLEVRQPAATGIAFDIVEMAGRQIVFRDGEGVADCTLSGLAPVVKSLVWTTAVNGHRYFLDIHAGVVGDDARCVLLPAPPGSGKSTLAAALVHAGFQFFSDEVALLEEGSLAVRPVPLALCIKQPGIAALADRFPLLRELRVHDRGDGKKVAYMPPPAGSLPAGDHARPVAALVFPRYERDADTVLLSLPKGEALKRLLDQCLVVPTRLDAGKVGALVEWITRVACFSLTYGSTEGSIAAIKSVFAAATERALAAPDRG